MREDFDTIDNIYANMEEFVKFKTSGQNDVGASTLLKR